jgi:hypothetical protein
MADTVDNGLVATSNPEPPVVFRSTKKRKAYRQRAEDLDTAPSTSITETNGDVVDALGPSKQDSQPPENVEKDSLSVAEALRLRNARRSKLNGVGYKSNQGPLSAASDDQGNGEDDRSLVVRNATDEGQPPQAEAAPVAVAKRFSAQTGYSGELVNKHM